MAISVNSNAKSLEMGSKLVGTLFFSVFFAMGLFFEIMVLRQTIGDLATYGWHSVHAVILSSEVVPPANDEADPVLHVRYRYTFGGSEFESNHIQAGVAEFETRDAYLLAQRYSAGAKITGFVNPERPEEAILQRKSLASALFALFPLVFVAIGSFGIWAMWRRKTNPDDAVAQPISSRAKNAKSGRRIMTGVFGLILLIGLGVGYPFFVRPLLKIAAAQSWASVPCEIVSSRVKTHSDSDGNTYRVDVVYRYTYQDRNYTANRYHFATGSSGGYERKAEVVRRLPAGTQAICFVDPADPSEAVLERSLTSDLWFGLIPFVFATFGAGGLIFTFRQNSSGADLSVFKPFSANARAGAGNWTPDHDKTAGPQTLKPASSPKMKLLGLMFAVVFWNGIVSVFLFNLHSQWRHGMFSWFIAVFLTPFVLIGLGLIGAVFYQFMALFNPRPSLTISSGGLHPGKTIDVSWSLAGRASRLRRLQITLEGREEATYRRGTDTRIDKEIFARIQLVDTSDLTALQNGTARLHLPPGAMHSFKSANNKIVWTLTVQGDIPRWPDIKEEYSLNVEPNPIIK